MSKFLKLPNRIINAANISDIIIHPNEFHIYISPKTINLFIIYGCGYGGNDLEHLKICKKENPYSYQAVEHWIKNINN